jgi:hypothetical protein
MRLAGLILSEVKTLQLLAAVSVSRYILLHVVKQALRAGGPSTLRKLRNEFLSIGDRLAFRF